MIATLVMIVCVSATPTHCTRVELVTDSCSAAGQGPAAMWLAQHPGMRIERVVSCQAGRAA